MRNPLIGRIPEYTVYAGVEAMLFIAVRFFIQSSMTVTRELHFRHLNSQEKRK